MILIAGEAKKGVMRIAPLPLVPSGKVTSDTCVSKEEGRRREDEVDFQKACSKDVKSSALASLELTFATIFRHRRKKGNPKVAVEPSSNHHERHHQRRRQRRRYPTIHGIIGGTEYEQAR
jgi:hypothetical protein